MAAFIPAAYIRHMPKLPFHSRDALRQNDWIEEVPGYFSRDLSQAAYELLRDMYLPPATFFMPVVDLKQEVGVSLLEQYLPIPAAQFLCFHLTTILGCLGDQPIGPGSGFEVWCGHTTGALRGGAYLHVDNDEARRLASGECVSPTYGSILYLGPGGRLPGGETIFLDPSRSSENPDPFRTYSREALINTPGSKIVLAQQGKLVIFRGHVLHAVLPLTDRIASPRVTLLANFWRNRPINMLHRISALSSIEYLGGGPIR
jgi:hypothetical protein